MPKDFTSFGLEKQEMRYRLAELQNRGFVNAKISYSKCPSHYNQPVAVGAVRLTAKGYDFLQGGQDPQPAANQNINITMTKGAGHGAAINIAGRDVLASPAINLESFEKIAWESIEKLDLPHEKKTGLFQQMKKMAEVAGPSVVAQLIVTLVQKILK